MVTTRRGRLLQRLVGQRPRSVAPTCQTTCLLLLVRLKARISVSRSREGVRLQKK
jgi:hypothetical protein